MAAAVTFTDAPSYSSSSTGTLVEAKTGADTQAGAASATGALVDGRIGANAATGSSTASSSITETRTAVNAVSGVSSSSSTITDVHSVTYIDAPSALGSSAATPGEQRTGSNTTAGTSASTATNTESRTGSDPLNYVGSAVATLLVVTGIGDAPSGASTSTAGLSEAYSSPTSQPADLSGLPALLDLLTHRAPAADPLFRDRPRGVSHSTHTLEERHTVAVPTATYIERTLQPAPRARVTVSVVHDDVDIEELVSLGLI